MFQLKNFCGSLLFRGWKAGGGSSSFILLVLVLFWLNFFCVLLFESGGNLLGEGLKEGASGSGTVWAAYWTVWGCNIIPPWFPFLLFLQKYTIRATHVIQPAQQRTKTIIGTLFNKNIIYFYESCLFVSNWK